MRRFLILGSIFAAIVFVLLLSLKLVSGSGEQSDAIKPLQVSVLALQKSDHYTVQRSYIGRVEAKQVSTLAFEYPGQVLSLSMEEGDKVRPQQLLAQLDVEEVLMRRQEAKARLDGARAQRDLSADTLARSIRAGTAVSAQALEQARLNHAASEAELKALQASLSVLDIRLKKSILFAPYSGTITRRYVDEGASIDAGRPVFDVQSDELPKLRVGLPGQLAADLEVGQFLQIRLNDEELEAELRAVLPLRDALTRTVDILLQSPVDADAGDLVELMWQRRRAVNGFWLPLSALTQSVRGLWAAYHPVPVEDAVYRLEARLVEIIHSDDKWAFVRGNLADGDVVVSDGLLRVVPGQLVRVKGG